MHTKQYFFFWDIFYFAGGRRLPCGTGGSIWLLHGGKYCICLSRFSNCYLGKVNNIHWKCWLNPWSKYTGHSETVMDKSGKILYSRNILTKEFYQILSLKVTRWGVDIIFGWDTAKESYLFRKHIKQETREVAWCCVLMAKLSNPV